MKNDALESQAQCLVVGAGEMGRAHIKVLTALLPGRVTAWAPSERNREAVEKLGATFFSGQSPESLVSNFSLTHAVIAAPVEELPSVAGRLIDAGVKHILLEKPAALDVQTAQRLLEQARSRNTTIHVAYNRRFYASVRTARSMLAQAKEKISSVLFEFTEWSDVIQTLTNQSKLTKEHWLLANSMHVIDTALHPVGLPQTDNALFIQNGSLDWHPSASAFAGAGRAADGTPFACCANWDAPGRWGFEWMSRSTRYIFRPLEKLHVMRRGSVAIEEVALLDDFDERFKPGVFLQNRAFLTQDDEHLPDLTESIELIKLAQAMAAYPKV